MHHPPNHRVTSIRNTLMKAFDPVYLDIEDHSESHKNHRGAKESGGGHFVVSIVSEYFVGQSLRVRHQNVYQALGSLMTTDIHAVSIKAKTPEEDSQIKQKGL